MMNDQTKQDNFSLEEIRTISLKTLISLHMEKLKDLQQQADKALFSAKLTKDWIDGAINFKLWEESKHDESNQ